MARPLIGVRRDRGSRYLLLTILAFAVTVMAVRVYLDSAGYPKVGGGGLHVAHTGCSCSGWCGSRSDCRMESRSC
jgi:hypothetical protein